MNNFQVIVIKEVVTVFRALPVSLLSILLFLNGCQPIQTRGDTAGSDELIVSTPAASKEILLFASFRDNGQDSLHLSYSQDGLNWKALKNDQRVLTPQVGTKLMRDLVIIRGVDNRFHMVWTSGWEDAEIGLAHSDNLIEWSEQALVPVMVDYPTAKNAWAPEIYWEDATQQYWIYWVSTIPGTYPDTEKQADKGWDHRIFATTTKDFETSTQSELFYQPGFNVIDATIVNTGDNYIMLVKDENRYPPAKHLLVATASDIQGSWQWQEQPFSPAGVWVEGPAIVELDGWYYVYFDQYMEHSFGTMRTHDFKTWENLTEQLYVPQGSRHGSMVKITR